MVRIEPERGRARTRKYCPKCRERLDRGRVDEPEVPMHLLVLAFLLIPVGIGLLLLAFWVWHRSRRRWVQRCRSCSHEVSSALPVF